MIRPAVEQDIPAIIAMIEAYRGEVRPDLSLHRAHVAQTVSTAILHDSGLVLVLESNGLQGLLIALAGPSPWWPGQVADMLIWWVHPDLRGKPPFWAARLLTGLENWAAQIGAAQIGASYTGKSAQTFLRRQGYKPAETRMMLDLT